jgi:hypothetical protein
MKIKSSVLYTLLLSVSIPAITACSDYFDQKSNHVIYAGNNHLSNASDTLYSVLGIVNKLQRIADRTILLGEMRGDLVDVTSATSADLRDVATFNIGDSNVYNRPRDYYAVINNCNYFLANADTAIRNSLNERIFRKEYAAVKAFRAWTYLQLVLNYGRVPFVTNPIQTKDEAEAEYEYKDIKGICEYMLEDLAPYAEEDMPSYGSIRNNASQLFFYPIYILMGDLNLWAGHYREAALSYYKYLVTRKGRNSVSPIGCRYSMWANADWRLSLSSWNDSFSEAVSDNGDVICIIPCDSIRAEGNYSELASLFNTREDNAYKMSVIPSQSLRNLSAAQKYCYLTDAFTPIYAPANSNPMMTGDLRLSEAVETSGYTMAGGAAMQNENYQIISKYATNNVHVCRRTLVYLRMAEALNRAGFPHFAFKILQTGINNKVIEDEIIPHYPGDEAWLRQFDFPTISYQLATNPNNLNSTNANTMGIHTRGSGWSNYNEYYQMPDNAELQGAALLNWQMDKVEDLIVAEEALEFAFEGYRFYDLMRVALRRNAPSYLASRIYARRGQEKVDEMKKLIRKDLTNTANWYLGWRGKIGY